MFWEGHRQRGREGQGQDGDWARKERKPGAAYFELVTLGGHVKGVVEVPVNLLRLTVLAEEAAEDARTANPQHLNEHR